MDKVNLLRKKTPRTQGQPEDFLPFSEEVERRLLCTLWLRLESTGAGPLSQLTADLF